MKYLQFHGANILFFAFPSHILINFIYEQYKRALRDKIVYRIIFYVCVTLKIKFKIKSITLHVLNLKSLKIIASIFFKLIAIKSLHQK